MAGISNHLILGTVQFGLDYGISNTAGQVPQEEAFAILQYARQQGITLLDSADAYGNAQEVIGKWHQENPPFSLISKFVFRDEATPLKEKIKTTLSLLKVQQLYAYYFHSFAEYKKNPERVNELFELKREGSIRKTGVSVYTNDELDCVIADDRINVIQLPYNCLDNYAIRGKLLHKAKHARKEIHVRSVFLQGLFFMDPASLPEKIKPLGKYLLRLREIAAAAGLSMRELALLYALEGIEGNRDKIVDYLVIGVDTVAQLRENISLSASRLPPGVWEAVNDIKVNETELLSPSNWK